MGRRGEVRRFVHLAFAGVFVRHYELLLLLCGFGGGIDEVLEAIRIIFSRVSDGMGRLGAARAGSTSSPTIALILLLLL
jgi:hypothetical protein